MEPVLEFLGTTAAAGVLGALLAGGFRRLTRRSKILITTIALATLVWMFWLMIV
jgi:hypothetical protein